MRLSAYYCECNAVLFMLTGVDAYPGASAGLVVHHKMTAGDRQVNIPQHLEESQDRIVQELVSLVRNCTLFDRKKR